MTKKQKRIYLTQSQSYKLYNYCETHRNQLDNLSVDQAVKTVEPKLAFSVSKTSMRKACKEFDITLRKVYTKRTPKMAELERLQCEVKSLAIALKELYDDVGSKVHPSVVKILERYTKE